MCLEDGQQINCRLVVDSSGHFSELVERVGEHNPGVQIAYGAEVEVKGKSHLARRHHTLYLVVVTVL